MNYQADITDLLARTVSNMSFGIKVDSVVLNDDETQTITACDIFHAQVGYDVTIGTNKYTITAFSYNPDTLTLQGEGTINVGDVFELYKPFFRHGTPRAVEGEIKPIQVTQDKMPMIWLWENYKEKIADEFDPIYSEMDLDLEILTNADHEMWGTDELYRYAVKPMRRLWNSLFNQIKSEIGTYDAVNFKHEIEPFSKFGVFERTKGSMKSVFSDKLTGVSVSAHFKVFAVDVCECPIVDLPELGRSFNDSFDNSFN